MRVPEGGRGVAQLITSPAGTFRAVNFPPVLPRQSYSHPRCHTHLTHKPVPSARHRGPYIHTSIPSPISLMLPNTHPSSPPLLPLRPSTYPSNTSQIRNHHCRMVDYPPHSHHHNMAASSYVRCSNSSLVCSPASDGSE